MVDFGGVFENGGAEEVGIEGVQGVGSMVVVAVSIAVVVGFEDAWCEGAVSWIRRTGEERRGYGG